MLTTPSKPRNCSILSAFTALGSISEDFVAALSSKFSENQFSSLLQTFLNTIPPKETLENLPCTPYAQNCPRYTLRTQVNFDFSFCEFVLKLNFNHSAFVEQPILLSAFEKLTYLSSFTNLLNCTPIKHSRSISGLLQELATPSTQHSSHSWKEKLVNELLRDAHSKYENIIQTVGYVCRDLEERCTNVEQPLRKANEEIVVLNETIETLTRERLILEQKVSGLMNDMEDMKRENEGTIHELKCTRIELEGCRRHVVEERERWEQESEQEREQWKEREEELLTTNSILDEELKDTQSRVKELDEKVLCAEEENTKLTDGIAETASKLSELEKATDAKLARLEELQAEKEEEITHARRQCRELEIQITDLKEQMVGMEVDCRKALEQATKEADLKVAAHREEYAKEISSLQNKLSVAQASFVKDTEKRETEYRKLTRQVQRLKRINEDQRQEMLKMVDAHDRLQRAAAEMNTLRTRSFLANSDPASLSQQFSQIPVDVVEQSDAASSPVAHRSKRTRMSETPLRRRSQRLPLSALKNQANISPVKVSPTKGKEVKMGEEVMGSVTQSQEGDEERHVPLKSGISGSEYGDLFVDEDGFSQFDIS